MQNHEDIPYRIYGIERQVFTAWTRTPQPEPRLVQSNPFSPVGFMHADRVLKMRDVIISRPRISDENLIELGASVGAEDQRLRQLFNESQKGYHRKAGRKATSHQDDHNATLMTENAAKKARDPNTIKEMKKELDVAIARLDSIEGEVLRKPPTSVTLSTGIQGGFLLATSAFGKARLGSTASSKLNYIINEVSILRASTVSHPNREH